VYRSVRRVLFMQIGGKDRRPWHRYTLREWFLLTAAYAVLVTIVPAMFDLSDRIRRKYNPPSNGLRQFGLAIHAYKGAPDSKDATDSE
jgi:hypothetical protein